MALDRTKIFIADVNINALVTSNESWTSYTSKAFTNKYKHRMDFYKCGAMVCDVGVFHLEYLRKSLNNGDLIISFSISKAFNGNNSIPKSNVSVSELYSLLESRLNCVLDIKQLPSTDHWTISKVENNCDIVDTIENLLERFNLLIKTKIPYRKLDDSLADEGTLNFYSGKTKGKSSTVITIYFKVKEQQSKNIDIHPLLSLEEGIEDLRIEEKNTRRALKRKLAKFKSRYNLLSPMYFRISNKLSSKGYCSIYENDMSQYIPFGEINVKIEHKRLKEPCYSFYRCLNYEPNIKANAADILDKNYQFSVIRDLIKSCNLDKIITTKDELYKVIDRSHFFTKKTKHTAKRVIRCLNGEIGSIDLNNRTVDHYRKLILETGYNCLYATRELKPITEGDILRIMQEDKNLNMICQWKVIYNTTFVYIHDLLLQK